MGNPLDSAVQSFQGLHAIDNEDKALALSQQSHDLAKQQFAASQAALQFQQNRQTAEDVRSQGVYDAGQAAIQKKNDLDTTQALGYNVANAQAANQTEIPYESQTPAVQNLAVNNGYVNTRVAPDGSGNVQTIDTAKLTTGDLQSLSPIYAGKSAPEVAELAGNLGTVRNNLDTIKGDMEANPQKYANGMVMTQAQYPELFDALNKAVAPQVNKGLDDTIVKKEVNTAVINPDGTISLQVESFDADGGSLGNAPVTVGRSNGDPSSVVMKIPAQSLYDYIDVNEQLGQQIKAKQIELGDDAPLKVQTAEAKSKKLADALTPEMMGADSSLDPGAQNRMALVKSLVGGGIDTPTAIQAAKLIHPDRIPKVFTSVKNVIGPNGEIGTAAMDGTNGKIDMSTWTKTKEPVDPGVAAANRTAATQAAKEAAENRKRDQAVVDKASSTIAQLGKEAKGLYGADLIAKNQEIAAATEDYVKATAAYSANNGGSYDPTSGTNTVIAKAATSAVNTEQQKPAVDFLKGIKGGEKVQPGSPDGLRKTGWSESAIQAACATAKVPYTPPPSAAPPPALTRQQAPALTRTSATPLQVGKYKVQVN
jgi:hypothetical protein